MSGKLRILIDSRLDLQRSVDQLRFRKVVDHRRPVLRAVAAPGNPANQVVPIRRRKGQDFHELFAGFARQFHQHKVRLHRLSRLLTSIAHPNFGGDRPQILTVVERFRIRHVIQAVHFRLQFQQQLGVAHVLAQSRRHQGRILEQTRKDAAVGRDDRILRIEHVKRCRAVVGVDDHLHTVPHVVNEILVETVMSRVGIAV